MGFALVLLRDAGFDAALVDQNMSVMEGSIGILQGRLLVAADQWQRAVRVLEDAELGQWVNRDVAG